MLDKKKGNNTSLQEELISVDYSINQSSSSNTIVKSFLFCFVKTEKY